MVICSAIPLPFGEGIGGGLESRPKDPLPALPLRPASRTRHAPGGPAGPAPACGVLMGALRGGGSLCALTVALVFVAGCPPPPGVPPSSRREAIERVNSNLGQIVQPLQYNGWVSFKFRDDRGRMHAFDLNEARLIYAPPQLLLFDVRSGLVGTVAQFGSNDKQYWLWIDVPDYRKLWRGAWRHVSVAGEQKLPIPPNELFDALMLRPLPESLEGGQLPLLRVAGENCWLLFVRLGAGGQPIGYREIRLAPQPPYQPLEVIDRLPDGELIMNAQLTDYQRIGAAGPFTARRYVVRWPQHAAEMRLDITGAKFRSNLPEDLFASPEHWQGEIEEIDDAAEGVGHP
jgi:hypothetical protein